MTDKNAPNKNPGNDPKEVQREAKALQPNQDRAVESDTPLEPREQRPLTGPEGNAKVDRVSATPSTRDRVIVEQVTTHPVAEPQPVARSYLVSPSTLRNLFIASSVLGVALIVGILTLASSGNRGRYTPAEETQYQQTLLEATEALNTTALNEGGETARIPIEEAMSVVAAQGLESINKALMPAADGQAGAEAGNAAAPAGDNPYAADAAAIEEGKALFVGQLGCAGCHGQDGTGAIGPNLTDAEWIYGGSDADIFETVTNGRPGGMPSFAQQTDEDTRWKVVSYVLSLSQGQ